MRITRWIPFVALALLPACATDPTEVGSEQGAIEISVAPPPEVSCLSLHLVDENHAERDVPLAIASQITVPDIAVGAYMVRAYAYAAAHCDDIPERPPWGTLQPQPLIVTRGSAELSLTLYRLGSVVLGTGFVETPEVVAQGQARLSTLAADGDRIAWVMRPGSDTNGSVATITDNEAGNATVVSVATGVQRPGDLAFAPGGPLFWTSWRSSVEPPVSNGAIYRWSGGAPVTVASGQLPGEIAVAGGQVYWNAMDTGEIRSAPVAGGPFTSYAAPGNNSLTSDATHVYWTSWGDRAIRRAALGSTVVEDVVPAGIEPLPGLGIAVDELNIYWSDWDEADSSSAIRAVPRAGGPSFQVFPPPGEPRVPGIWPIETDGGWVYFANGTGVYRVARAGGQPAELIQEGAVLGFAVTRWGGHAWLYWSDREFNGVVWRQRLD